MLTYSLNLNRTLDGYQGVYKTTVTGIHPDGHPWRYDHNTAEQVINIPLPGPGNYVVNTGVESGDNSVKEITVA